VALGKIRGRNVTDLAALRLQLDKLYRCRATGARRIEIGERRVEYRSHAELAQAISAIEAEIAKLENTPVVRNVVVRAAHDRRFWR
jgi:hypothetical protein